ncbi:hypothetical protein L207DRAFT_639165 [Hyaloscypha variabilis F]|uniref:Uncharacterized protein n=1 Tax=Hyaloscypha variabilis (strain UAMH 11265 / GT02V1 / F) TaxID=1149755 RepID=A0A2J6R5G8_HYAVF|nr:hypothetical protein L207DRAFT_639165 [Hyaloscypha variabilis F]
MAEQQPIALPNELWIRILQNLDNDEDIAELWTTCRHVCTAFKRVVESICRDRHLPKTRLNFRLGRFTGGRNGRQLPDITLMAEFEFAELSEDICTAKFRLNDDIPEELIPTVKERMQTSVENMDIAAPKHSIQIRRDVLDGPIPSLSYDQAKCEVNCNWRDLFTAFYGEEALARRLTNQWLDNQVAYLDELKRKFTRGEMGAERIISAAILEVGSGEKICRRDARRARIRHQFRKLDGRNWDPEHDGDSAKECDALNELWALKQFAQSEVFSDEEDSDEWEDEDEEDEENETDEEESTDDE